MTSLVDFGTLCSQVEVDKNMADKSRLPVPVPTPETAHYWEGTKQNELRLQRCQSCDATYFPPRPFCPTCASREVEVFTASGEATLYSYVINHLPHPAFDGPYAIAVVELKEGPRMMTNIVGVEQTPEALVLDMPLEVTFEALSEDITLPYFRPTGAAS
tara:strand:- start:8391 stop:8867 length:477 start_codon:yes stop_codon:yes gene_type:complete